MIITLKKLLIAMQIVTKKIIMTELINCKLKTKMIFIIKRISIVKKISKFNSNNNKEKSYYNNKKKLKAILI